MSSTTSKQKNSATILFILAIFFTLTQIYNVYTPLFEAPDEKSHFQFVYWLTENRGELPNILTEAGAIGHEVAQPPLYYWLLAQVIRPIDLSNFDTITLPNPHWQHLDDPHVWYHTAAESFPYQQATLAARLARSFTSLLALGTLIGSYMLIREISQKHALKTVLLIASIPQFIFLSATINNDNLLVLLCTWMLYLSLLTYRKMQTAASLQQGDYAQLFILGLLYGLATITKLSGLAFGLIIAASILWGIWQRPLWKMRFSAATTTLIGWLTSAGWWFWHNWTLYQDPIAYSPLSVAHQAIVRKFPLSLIETLTESAQIGQTFWYSLANANLEFVAPFYWLVNLIALIGLASAAIHYKRISPIQPLIYWIILITALLLVWIKDMNNAAQGRLLYPALPILAGLIVIGLAQLGRVGRYLQYSLLISLIGAAVAAPFFSLDPAFTQPNTWSDSPREPTDIVFDEQLSLQGYEITQESLAQEAQLELDLFWKGLQPISESHVIAIRVFDVLGVEIAQKDYFPAQARYPTNIWEPGKLFRDEYELPPLAQNATPGVASVQLAVHTWDSSANLLNITKDGDLIGDGIIIAQVPVQQPVQQPTPQYPLTTAFGSLTQLVGYDMPAELFIGEKIPVELHWLATGQTNNNYIVFVHMLNSAGELVAQADSAPQNNLYPTHIWQKGEYISDLHEIIDTSSLPAGDYQIFIGLYDSVTGERLTAVSDQGTQLDGNAQKVHILSIIEQSE